jgi:hypothetical protein
MKILSKTLKHKADPRSPLWIVAAALVLLVASACQTQTPESADASHEDATHEATATTTDEGLTSEDVQAEMGEAADTLGQYAYEQKEQFETAARKQLADMDARLDDLGKEAAMVREGARDQWKETVNQLQSQQDDLERALEQTLEVPAEGWLKARDELIEAKNGLAQMLEEVSEKLETTQSASEEAGSESASEA